MEYDTCTPVVSEWFESLTNELEACSSTTKHKVSDAFKVDIDTTINKGKIYRSGMQYGYNNDFSI